MTPALLASLVALAASPITLDEVRALGRANLDALKAELEVGRAEAGWKAARAPALPQLSFQTGLGYIATGPRAEWGTWPSVDANGQAVFVPGLRPVDGNGRGNLSLSLTVSQLLYDGARWWNDLKRASAGEEAARAQLDEQRLASVFEAERRFWELLRAQTTQDVLAASIQRSETQLERARSLFLAGRAQKRDSIDAEINLGQDRINALRQQQATLRARNDLLKWLGRPLAAVEAVEPGNGAAVPPPALDALLKAAREKRPLLQVLDARARAQDRAVDVAWSAYLPRVTGSVGYQRSSAALEPFVDLSKQHGVNLGVQLSWDLFSGLGTQAAVESARLEARAARLQLEQAALELEADVAQAHEAVVREQAALEIARANLELAKQSLLLAEERFGAGAGSTLDVRDAQVKLTQAELQALQGRVDVELARAQLRRVTGSLEGTP